MKTMYRRPAQPLMPPYRENSALQLIMATGVGFVVFHFARVIMLLNEISKEEVFAKMFPNFSLSSVELFKQKWWTIFTYGWLHQGFFDWFTNTVWLYCFGAVLQHLAGYRQLIPLFTYALLIGGGFYIGSELIFPGRFDSNQYFMGAQAGVMALGIAALTLAPRHQIHISEHFRFPLALIVVIYLALDLVVYLPAQLNILALCLGGALTGFVYAKLLQRRWRPGEWAYDIFDRLGRMTTPDSSRLAEKKSRRRVEILRQMYEPKKGISQQQIDAILDKINDHGYHALSRDEKELLFKAGSENPTEGQP